MGTWSVEAFGNDTAVDWSYSLQETTDLSVIERTLETFTEESAQPEAYIDAYMSEEAIAAIETLAKLQGNEGVVDAYTSAIDDWVKANPQSINPTLIEKAKSILKIVQSEHSELNELWLESDEHQEWVESLDLLAQRLTHHP